ncbi:MAG: glycosyltransferase [Ignavibacteriaceae bacterium]
MFNHKSSAVSKTNPELPREVVQYLAKYSAGKWKIETNISAPVTTAIVIPAIKEYDNLQKLLSSLIKNEPGYFAETLVIFVINNIPSSSLEIKEDNRKTIEFFRAIINKETGNALINDIISSGLQTAFIDASSAGLEMPEKDGGVGYARKIGMDLALTVFDYTSLKKKIILCLDADCIVKENYITQVIEHFNKKNLSAAAVNFEHQLSGEDETAKAIVCYEIFLRYYTIGLHFAGSPYAFHTVGSTMACDYESYIKIEGMNKRKAAEDFYFLEKLAKNSAGLFRGEKPVPLIYSTTVFPSSRGSWRVPFGTGQRVNRFLSKTRNEYLLYDPEVFLVLRSWLKLFFSNETTSCAAYLQKAMAIHPELYKFLIQQKFEADFNKIANNSKTNDQLHKQKIKWFDGFRTMKLIHYFRDNVYPDKNMFDALDEMFSLLNIQPGDNISHEHGIIPDFQVQKNYMLFLREIDKNYNT